MARNAGKTNEQLQSEDVTTQAEKAPRLSAVERLTKALAEAEAKDRSKLVASRDKLREELAKATVDFDRASLRKDKATAAVAALDEALNPATDEPESEDTVDELTAVSV